MKKQNTSARKPKVRYGIGEWYGAIFSRLSPEERKKYARIQTIEKKKRPEIKCPFRSSVEAGAVCTKEGGVCSLRLYQLDSNSNVVDIAPGKSGTLVTTCPNRFQQDKTIYEWIGKTLLNTPDPLVVNEIGFLEQDATGPGGSDKASDVGRIDNVIVHPTREPFRWCALETQAVYFSGATMRKEFKFLETYSKAGLPFPVGHRRPDFRSSGPKRLMPQLQIKVPTLRRWGKKMAVVVDRMFFDSLGAMDDVQQVSNCDIAWFVVRFSENGKQGVLEADFVRLTTLERAVEGLTGGNPVSLETFEERIRLKLVP